MQVVEVPTHTATNGAVTQRIYYISFRLACVGFFTIRSFISLQN